MQVSHASAAVSAAFDDPNLVSCAGLVPVAGAGRSAAGLAGLVDERVTLREPGGANAGAKVPALVAGMVAGADSIEDMDLLRHGGDGAAVRRGTGAVDAGHVPARRFAFGHVRQLDAVAAAAAGRLAEHTPLLPGAGTVAFLDVDDTVRADLRLRQAGRGLRLHRGEGVSTRCWPRSARRRRRR